MAMLIRSYPRLLPVVHRRPLAQRALPRWAWEYRAPGHPVLEPDVSHWARHLPVCAVARLIPLSLFFFVFLALAACCLLTDLLLHNPYLSSFFVPQAVAVDVI